MKSRSRSASQDLLLQSLTRKRLIDEIGQHQLGICGVVIELGTSERRYLAGLTRGFFEVSFHNGLKSSDVMLAPLKVR
jgi:hypothetical protein